MEIAVFAGYMQQPVAGKPGEKTSRSGDPQGNSCLPGCPADLLHRENMNDHIRIQVCKDPRFGPTPAGRGFVRGFPIHKFIDIPAQFNHRPGIFTPQKNNGTTGKCLFQNESQWEREDDIANAVGSADNDAH